MLKLKIINEQDNLARAATRILPSKRKYIEYFLIYIRYFSDWKNNNDQTCS